MGRKKADAETIATRRAQIVSGARQCFARHGYAGTRVEALEQCCGVTRGTLFKYYPNKKALLLAVVERETGAHRRIFERLTEELSARTTLRDVIGQAVQMQLRLSRQDPDTLRLRLELIRLGEIDPSLCADAHRFEQAQHAWRNTLVEQLFTRKLIHPDFSRAQAADMLSIAFLGLAASASYKLPMASSEDRIGELTADSLCLVLSHPPKRASPASALPA